MTFFELSIFILGNLMSHYGILILQYLYAYKFKSKKIS